METERAETVVEKVTSYVRDILGLPQGDHPPDVEAKPEYSEIAPALHFDGDAPAQAATPPATAHSDAARLDAFLYTTKSVGELNAQGARREDGE